jgi:hypothetical protein
MHAYECIFQIVIFISFNKSYSFFLRKKNVYILIIIFFTNLQLIISNSNIFYNSIDFYIFVNVF